MTTELRPWPSEARQIDSDLLLNREGVYRGFIAEEPRLHGAFRYAFKPMLADETQVAEANIKRQSEVDKPAAIRFMATTMAGRIVWTSATDGPLTTEQVLQLRDPIFYRLWSQLTGQSAMDAGVELED